MTSSIVFLSDLGIRDEMVGVCHAVMARIAPETRIIDIAHGVPPLDIQAGALALLQALPYVAPDAVVLAVVDPGSGTDRLAIAVRTTAGRLLVGPDNGLLSLAWAADDGIVEVVSITSPDVILDPPSPVLNARDVFAPAAARLAGGGTLAELGPSVDPGALVTIRLTDPEIEARKISAEVIDIDRFGNVRLNVRPAQLATAGFGPDEALEIASTGGGARLRRIRTYGEVTQDECGVLADAWGWISVIRFGASAAELLAVRVGDPVWLASAD